MLTVYRVDHVYMLPASLWKDPFAGAFAKTTAPLTKESQALAKGMIAVHAALDQSKSQQEISQRLLGSM